jgi:hypothetical protein
VDLEEWIAMAPTKNAQKLRRAAERKGKAEDQYQLGRLLYHRGEGLKQDWVAAAKCFCKAAAQEHASAQFCLGGCYSSGGGVEQSHEIAASWVSQAAAQGFATAQGDLGCLYAKGQGVEHNDALAVAWWKKAAVGGDPDSQSNLGLFYMHGGEGVPKNTHCAKIYMMAAAAHKGHKTAATIHAVEILKMLRACAACGAPDASRACQGCMSVTGLSTARYCNPKCQAAHWKDHKADCGGRQACSCHRCKSDRGETGA